MWYHRRLRVLYYVFSWTNQIIFKKLNRVRFIANLGSEGERILQKKVGSENKASAFYDKQLLDYLNPYMREFILKQEMVCVLKHN